MKASTDTVFIDRFTIGHGGRTIAVKDLIDIAGMKTTAACEAVEQTAAIAQTDAACLARIRAEATAGRLTVVGKTTLHELAFGATGLNSVYGTPANPLDASRMPGGSSSGSAVAVATSQADVALGSDTGGSIRIPAACCGVVGLKTTWGRISLDGVWPLAPFLDTVGPLARTVDDVIFAMDLLEGGFGARVPDLSGSVSGSVSVARARPSSVDTDPAVDAAVDAALVRAGIVARHVELPMWEEVQRCCLTVLLAQAWTTNQHLLVTGGVTSATADRLVLGAAILPHELNEAQSVRASALRVLTIILGEDEVLVLPSLPVRAPALFDLSTPITAFTRFANLLGLPAISLPVAVPASHSGGPDSHLPASIQIIGRPGGDEQVCAVARLVEAAQHAL